MSFGRSVNHEWVTRPSIPPQLLAEAEIEPKLRSVFATEQGGLVRPSEASPINRVDDVRVS